MVLKFKAMIWVDNTQASVKAFHSIFGHRCATGLKIKSGQSNLLEISHLCHSWLSVQCWGSWCGLTSFWNTHWTKNANSFQEANKQHCRWLHDSYQYQPLHSQEEVASSTSSQKPAALAGCLLLLKDTEEVTVTTRATHIHFKTNILATFVLQTARLFPQYQQILCSIETRLSNRR